MSISHRGTSRRLSLLAGVLVVVAACGGGASKPPASGSAGPGTSTPPGSATTAVDLTGATFKVGSKEFTEQLILGQITKLVLEDAGATVQDETGLVGSKVVRAALVSGAIDMYWEYTGTGWITHQGNTKPIVGSQEQYAAVRDADAKNNIVWLEPAAFNNTYAIALATEKATELKLTNVTELATYANANAAAATLCAASEFLGRDDGLPGLEKAYSMKFSDVSELDLGLVYTSIDKGTPCTFGEVFATDGRIAALGLTVLTDDKSFFPSYLPSLNVKKEVFDKYPKLADLFKAVAAALDTATITALNAEVAVDGKEPADVAKKFLQSKGLIRG